MARIFVQNRDVVVPGQLLAEGPDVEPASPYVEKRGDRLYSTILGLADVQENKIGVIPLEGPYIPKPGDIVIGLIVDVGVTHWEVDIRAPYTAILTAQEALDRPFNPATDDLLRYYQIGDYIVAKVTSFDRTHDPYLTVKGKGLGKIVTGSIVEIKPSRVPRVIGKKASMVNMLVSLTGCNIVVGQNGRILVQCRDKDLEEVLVLAIKKIEREAHIPGLTDRVRAFIEEELRRRGVNRG
ncbi:KH domain protein [Pyrolobus fumarii 1A]|uniref:Exosome complex component Rrp4 n=1 Tax=Pyrolobus fumarii (strain DSM 11204 / 1A) TaxID=694429 RepID=G0ECM8_PYRF1|nr:exosome complex RNA-binding protein Rrp4 [Pyrolobus fumarii]AEM39598.1 KH domain protein [Pyrolobus fumarii 1A]